VQLTPSRKTRADAEPLTIEPRDRGTSPIVRGSIVNGSAERAMRRMSPMPGPTSILQFRSFETPRGLVAIPCENAAANFVASAKKNWIWKLSILDLANYIRGV
jgi:hypothetical protein